MTPVASGSSLLEAQEVEVLQNQTQVGVSSSNMSLRGLLEYKSNGFRPNLLSCRTLLLLIVLIPLPI